MSLRFICIEVRPNLRCANVFLQFDHSLTETEFLKIVLENEALTLREYSTATRVALDKYFTVEARTVSNLIVEECNASFRLNIDTISKPKHEEVDTTEMQTCTAGNANGMSVVTDKPYVIEGELVSLICLNCECALTSVVEFRRVREFPSGSIDTSEFFCHHGPQYDDVLVPKLTDFFYGFQFVVLNEELVKKHVREKDIHVYCKRCLKHLGEIILHGKAVKLWADALKLHLEAECEDRICDIFRKDERTATSRLLNKIVNETTVDEGCPQTLLQHMHFSKVLLEATFANRQSKFLLLQILEKKLEILRNIAPLAHGSHNNNNVLQVKLESCKSFKVLYRTIDDIMQPATKNAKADAAIKEKQMKKSRVLESQATICAATFGHAKTAATHEEAANYEEDRELIKKWKNDMSIHTMKISPTLFKLLLDELEMNALLLPEIYRYTQDDFQLSYIFDSN